jgi:PHP family Zn ribbon phosphoesterase
MDFSQEIYELLPNIKNVPEKMGDQVFVNEEDEILGEVEKYLVISIPLSIDEIEKKVHDLGGLFIPAHADRPAFSMFSQLGYIPKGNYDAIEVTRIPPMVQNPLTQELEPLETYDYPLISDSDAHYEEHIGRRTTILEIEGNITLDSIRKALIQKKT